MNNNHLGIYIIYKDYLFFTLFLFLINISTYCQTTSGKILDTETQKPIENVNVFLTKNKSIGTTSNENGEFTLKFKGIVPIFTSKISIKFEPKIFKLSPLQTVVLEIELIIGGLLVLKISILAK